MSPKSDRPLRVGRRLWRRLIRELGRRAGGTRESGAFLLGPRNGAKRVTRIVFFDDLDPTSLRGGIRLGADSFSRLWSICDGEALVVLADVHTHPGDWVGQSSIDQEDPMIALRGHVALIVPYLASGSVRIPQVGFHRYLGDDGWASSNGHDVKRAMKIEWWH